MPRKAFCVKLVRNVTGSLQSALLKFIGYDLTAGFGKQSEATKYGLFAMSVLLPVATGIFGLVPKLFYDLSGEKKDRMYSELYARRQLATQEASANAAAEVE